MGTTKWGAGGGNDWSSQIEMWEDIRRNGFNGESFPTVMHVDGTTLPDFTPRVRAGMDLLDKMMPGWQDSIDTDSLDLEDDSQCVLGQAWPHYAKTRELLEKVDDPTEFRKFVTSLAPSQDGEEQMDFAGSIGTALTDADFCLINAAGARKAASMGCKPGGAAYGVEAHRESRRLVKRTWEALTQTWVREIKKGKEEGRWSQSSASAPSATTEVNHPEVVTATSTTL